MQTTPIVKIAPMAAVPAKERSPSSIAKTAQKTTATIGVWVYELRLYNQREKGRAPSREKAKIWRDVATSCNTRLVVRLQKPGHKLYIPHSYSTCYCSRCFSAKTTKQRKETHIVMMIKLQTAKVPFIPRLLKMIYDRFSQMNRR